MEERYAADDPELYRAAAGVIVERGHTQRVWMDREKRVCLGGAIRTAMTGSPHRSFGDNLWYAVIRDATGISQPFTWNDIPGRTAGEVTDLLIGIAKWLEEQAVAPPAPPIPKPQPGGPMGPPPGDEPPAPPDTER